jgi:CheY-like chemotaxis protein
VKILIIDDESDFLDYLESNLHQGFPKAEIMRAENGREALQKCAESKFDIICADIQMPAMNGLEFTRKLRESEGPNSSVPIIFISGYSEAFREDADQLSNTFFVDKPLRVPNFLNIVSLASGCPLHQQQRGA